MKAPGMYTQASVPIRLLILISLIVASQPLARAQKRFDTEITQIAGAQVQTMIDTGFFPDRQPVVYWHDPE